MDRITGVTEGSSRVITFTLKDETGAAVPLSQIAAARLTLYDLDAFIPGSPASGILNDRNDQDVKNINDVTIHATSGLVTWTMQPEDNVIVTERRQVERHRACFTFETSAGIVLDYEFEIEVANLGKVA